MELVGKVRNFCPVPSSWFSLLSSSLHRSFHSKRQRVVCTRITLFHTANAIHSFIAKPVRHGYLSLTVLAAALHLYTTTPLSPASKIPCTFAQLSSSHHVPHFAHQSCPFEEERKICRQLSLRNVPVSTLESHRDPRASTGHPHQTTTESTS